MVFAMAGCGNSRSAEEGTTETVAEATTEVMEETTVLDANADSKLLYCITPDASDPYVQALQDACTEEGEELGYSVKCVSHEDDEIMQLSLFQTAIAEGASAIICENAGADVSVEAAERAYDAGIPVFMVDREVNQDGLCVAQIVSDDVQGAALSAQYLIETTGGEGKYAELLGMESDTNSELRSNAFHSVIDDTNMELVAQKSADWDRATAKKKTEKILKDNPDIVAIVCGNDEMACGAADAVASAGLDHEVYIIGMDGTDDMRDLISSENCLCTSLRPVAAMARMAVDQADQYLATGTTGLDEKQEVECVLITKENTENLEGFIYGED